MTVKRKVKKNKTEHCGDRIGDGDSDRKKE